MDVEAYLCNLLAVTALMTLGWVVSLVRNDVTHVDALWGLGFVLIAWLTWHQVGGHAGRRLLIPVLTTIWGLRLAVYMHWRSHGKGEDPRYAQWRKATGDRFWWVSLFKVFLLQAVVLWIIALVIQAGTAGTVPRRAGILEVIGLAVWLLGFGFETIGDWQLARFKADPANAGRVMDRGLWRYTRHPNYFGECLIWWGLYLIVLSAPAHWWTVISPLLVTLVLLKMTGVPLTEKSLAARRPGYRAYMERTSPFFPWRPRASTSRPDGVSYENRDSTG